MSEKLAFKVLKLLIAATTLFCLTACSKKPIPVSGDDNRKPLHVYMIFSPIDNDKNQLELASQFLANATEDGDNEQTKIIVPINNYTIAKICHGDKPTFPLPKLELHDPESSSSVTSEIERYLTDMKDKTEKCNATPFSLVELSKYLNDAAKHPENGKLIIFLQAPWKRDNLDAQSKDLKAIELSMNTLAKSGQVEKIVLFGVSEDSAAIWGTSFKSFNKEGSKKFEISTDINQAKEFLKIVRKNYLE